MSDDGEEYVASAEYTSESEALAEDQPDDRPPSEWNIHHVQRAALTAKERMVVWPGGRRIGKSEGGVIWTMMRAAQANALGMKGVLWIVEPTYRLCRVPWRKMFRLAPPGWITDSLGTEENPDTVRFDGVSVEFRSGEDPGKLVAEGLLGAWLDECGDLDPRVWNESIRPTLMDHRAPAMLTGTPKGQDWFWRAFRRGLDPFVPDTLSIAIASDQGTPSYMNPFIDKAEIDDIARELPEREHSQEILAKFLSSDGAVFHRIDEALADLSTLPTVALGVDLARRKDFTVIIGMDKHQHVTYFDRFRDIDWPIQKNRIAAAYEKLGKPIVILDSTGVGDPIVQDLAARRVRCEGYLFTGKSRQPLIDRLIIALEERRIKIPREAALVEELRGFQMKELANGNVRMDHGVGGHDDCVMSLALCLYGSYRFGDLGFTF